MLKVFALSASSVVLPLKIFAVYSIRKASKNIIKVYMKPFTFVSIVKITLVNYKILV